MPGKIVREQVETLEELAHLCLEQGDGLRAAQLLGSLGTPARGVRHRPRLFRAAPNTTRTGCEPRRTSGDFRLCGSLGRPAKAMSLEAALLNLAQEEA